VEVLLLTTLPNSKETTRQGCARINESRVGNAVLQPCVVLMMMMVMVIFWSGISCSLFTLPPLPGGRNMHNVGSGD
jgi:hypothetical protein